MLELQDIVYEIVEDGVKKRILDHVNLELPDNTFVAITGPNGGGKSTLAKIIMGILMPTSGKILYKGQDITHLPINERADLGISFAFQQPVRFKGISVGELISLAAEKKLTKETMCEYLTKVGLCAADYIDRPADNSLSGGEMKRIEIATLLAHAKNMSIFDEPEAGIDLWSFQNLITIFKELQQRRDGSILIISHQERILEIADEIIILAEGKLVQRGPSSEILPQLLCADQACAFCPNVAQKGVLA